jgi:cytochrome c oxidase subunit 1
MRDRRFLTGAWLAGALGAVALNGLETRGTPPFNATGDTYFLLAHPMIAYGLAGLLVLFAGLHVLIERLFEVRIRASLAWTHFGLTLLGATLVLGSPLLIPLSTDRLHDVDAIRALAAWNLVSTLGYLTILVGLGVFAWALLDAARRWGDDQ